MIAALQRPVAEGNPWIGSEPASGLSFAKRVFKIPGNSTLFALKKSVGVGKCPHG